jgi:recombinational DNA repair ATPase RecF
MLETVYIEKKTNKKPILLIDDLMSELDEIHKEMLTKKIKYYQTFISSISQLEERNNIML